MFAHLSDLHLTSLAGASHKALRGKRFLGYLSWRRKRRHEHRREVLDRITARIAAETPQQIIISGDLTHVGLPGEFEEAARWLGELGPPDRVCVIPGNHELCVREGAAGLARWQAYLAGDRPGNGGDGPFPSLRVRAGVAFIGVSSAVATPALFATGRVGDRQRGALRALLEDTAKQGLFRVVYVHHCPVPGIDKWRKRLVDAPLLRDILQDAGVELVLHGHGHRSLSHPLDTSAGRAQVLGVASGSAAGRYGGEPAGARLFSVRAHDGGWTLDEQRLAYDPGQDSVSVAQSLSHRITRAHAGRSGTPGSEAVQSG